MARQKKAGHPPSMNQSAGSRQLASLVHKGRRLGTNYAWMIKIGAERVIPSAMIKFILTLALLATLGGPGLLNAAAKPGKSADVTAAAKQIDAILATDWKKNKLQPNPPANDETFVRRVYLDIMGRIPTDRETEEFLNSKDRTSARS